MRDEVCASVRSVYVLALSLGYGVEGGGGGTSRIQGRVAEPSVSPSGPESESTREDTAVLPHSRRARRDWLARSPSNRSFDSDLTHKHKNRKGTRVRED